MNPYYNDSFAAEKFYDNMYNDMHERSETVSTETCPDCNGEGKEYYSACCGAPIIKDICTDCKQPCEEESETCCTCNGEGEITN